MTQKNKGHGIYHDLVIKGPVSKVFEAVTDAEKLIHWWPLKCNGNPELNSSYNFYFSEEYNWYGKVVKLDINSSFHVKMTRSDEDWNPTTFRFDLEQKKESVLLKFSHVDWPHHNEHFRRSSFCWAMLLNGLKNYVENGTIVPFEKRN